MSNDVSNRDEFNAVGQPNQPQPHGHSLMRPTSSAPTHVIGAVPVAIKRELPRIRETLKEIAAMAGEAFYYRFPVRSADGSTDYIEGPTIKLANELARTYGNNETIVRVQDYGDSWMFYARFNDYEAGFSMERAYQQRKGQTTIKTKDVQRAQDQVFQIGQSKAIRNVIVNSLQMLADFAVDEARNSLVNKIGKDVEHWRGITIDRLKALGVELNRVERVIGRTAKDWLAPDIARVIAMGKAINEGMATIDETFPPVDKADASAISPPSSAAAGSTPPDDSATKQEQARPMTEPATAEDYIELVNTTCAAASDAGQLRNWFASETQKQLRTKVKIADAQLAVARTTIAARIKELEK